jgi:hypothetical protein
MDSNRPYYFVAWNQDDNPECNYTTESRDPCWWRVYVAEIHATKSVSLTQPLLKNEAKTYLERIKLLIGEDGQYDD